VNKEKKTSKSCTSCDGNIYTSISVGRAPVERKHLQGCMWSMQCNVEFGYQLSICSRIEKTSQNLDRDRRSQGLPDADWLLASGAALNARTLTLVPVCAVALFEKLIRISLDKFILCTWPKIIEVMTDLLSHRIHTASPMTATKIWVRTSQETHYFSVTKPNRLMMFGETVAVYCENHTEHINTLCEQNVEALYIRIQFVPHRKHIASPLQRPTS
jgi:hypothetical protein